MATTFTASQIPELFLRLLSPVKVVQDAIEESTENKSLAARGARLRPSPSGQPIALQRCRHQLSQQLHGFERVLLHREDAVFGQGQ